MSREQLRQKLESPYHKGLFLRTYDSVRDRLEPDGYFPESLTGAYPGMFPRTTGAIARLFIDLDMPELAEANIHYCLQAMIDNDMDRIAHVVGPRAESGTIPIIDGDDEIDGQAHVLVGWAMLAHYRGRTSYEDATYPIVADLLDRSVSQPYLYEDRCRRIRPGLVRNINLEHLREEEFWDTYDFLTQSFICSALEKMIPIARRHNDERRAAFWADRLAFIIESIGVNMIRDLDGIPIYYEMLLPTGRAPVPYPGLSWLNLAPIPADWTGVDPTLFSNTVETWRRLARIEWDGPRVTGADWLPEGEIDHTSGKRLSNTVIGKFLGWEMIYCFNTGRYEDICDRLDFLEQVNEHELLAEFITYDPESKTWDMTDPGNGEQACWWVWAMIVVRKAAGLPPLPGSE